MIARFLLNRLDPRAAPIITRLTRVMAWPSLDVMVGAALALMIALAVLMVVHVPYVLRLPPPYSGGPLVVQSFITPIPPIDSVIENMAAISIVAFLIMPLVTAVAAVLIASADVRSEAFTLLKLTNIPRSALEQAYMVTALWRLRVPLALLVALLPVFAFGITDEFLVMMVSYIGSEHLIPADTTVRALFFAASAIGLWGMNLFAAASASQSALRGSSRLRPLVIIPVMVAMLIGLPGFCSLALVGPALGSPIAMWGRMGITTLGALGAGLGVGPFALWALTLWSARSRSHES